MIILVICGHSAIWGLITLYLGEESLWMHLYSFHIQKRQEYCILLWKWRSKTKLEHIVIDFSIAMLSRDSRKDETAYHWQIPAANPSCWLWKSQLPSALAEGLSALQCEACAISWLDAELLQTALCWWLHAALQSSFRHIIKVNKNNLYKSPNGLCRTEISWCVQFRFEDVSFCRYLVSHPLSRNFKTRRRCKCKLQDYSSKQVLRG